MRTAMVEGGAAVTSRVQQMHAAADAYAHRAAEYVEKVGSMAAVHPADLRLVEAWAEQADGAVLDAGCGPGHWTHHLASRGLSVQGIDITPAFIEHARSAYPDAHFEIADIDHLPYPDHTFDVVLSWYSTIHHAPDEICRPLTEFARVLTDGGVLVLGHFEGPTTRPFDHAVAPAHEWPTSELAAVTRQAGFSIVETHRRVVSEHRTHGAIVARSDHHRTVAPRHRGAGSVPGGSEHTTPVSY